MGVLINSESISLVQFVPEVAADPNDTQHTEIDRGESNSTLELLVNYVIKDIFYVTEIDLLLD